MAKRRTDFNYKAGWYDFDNGKRYYMRSGFEARWGKYLDFLVKVGEVTCWQYEAESFIISTNKGNTKTYIPDFGVEYKDNGYVFHETKGELTQKDVTKFRKMSREHPGIKIILVMQRMPKGRSKSAKRQAVLVDKAKKWVERVIDGGEILKQAGF